MGKKIFYYQNDIMKKPCQKDIISFKQRINHERQVSLDICPPDTISINSLSKIECI